MASDTPADRVLAASDFVADVLRRQPELGARLAKDSSQPLAPPTLAPGASHEWPALLRRYRQAESARLAWRDILGLDDLAATLAGTTALAETCLRLGLAALEADFAARHGAIRGTDGGAQRLVVFAHGKLGGGELNFSSDVDLV